MISNAQSNNIFGLQFTNSYQSLPAVFYKLQLPTPVQSPSLVLFNVALAQSLALNVDALQAHGCGYFAGNLFFADAQPFAEAYAGHQFGHFNMLGDGRAVMLCEHLAPKQALVDIQLKGSGRTPFSRSGDGRAALGPMLREYIISEAMFALGVPTTRSLAVVATGESIYRDTKAPSAVLTRVAASHIRVGTFQYAAALQDISHLKALADYTITRHYPALLVEESPYIALLNAVIEMQAALIAKWMQLGFIHGVMNTDNMSIPGETIDYGPCAFMNRYHSDTVFSSIDKNGRYAFGNQPNIAQWNLTRFAESLLPLLDASQEKAIVIATSCLDAFPKLFFTSWLAGMLEKFGLFNEEPEDAAFIESFLMYLQKHDLDYTNAFVALSTNATTIDAFVLSLLITHHENAALLKDNILNDIGFCAWFDALQARIKRQPQSEVMRTALMHRVNAKVIPRNHLVEEALSAAQVGDLSLVHQLLKVLATPYEPFAGDVMYTAVPSRSFDKQYKTFCGT